MRADPHRTTAQSLVYQSPAYWRDQARPSPPGR